MYASYRDWMKWELDKAIEKGVPIIGIIPRDQERISNIVGNRANEIMHWNTFLQYEDMLYNIIFRYVYIIIIS